MKLHCEICSEDLGDFLDGYRRNDILMADASAKHAASLKGMNLIEHKLSEIPSTINIRLDPNGKPRYYFPGRINAGWKIGLQTWLYKQGTGPNGTEYFADYFRTPRTSTRFKGQTWKKIAEAFASNGFSIDFRQEFKANPDATLCSEKCADASILSADICKCICGGRNHATQQLAESLGRFHWTIEEETHPETGILTKIIRCNADHSENTLKETLARFAY